MNVSAGVWRTVHRAKATATIEKTPITADPAREPFRKG